MAELAGYTWLVAIAGAAAVLSAAATPLFAAYASRTGIVVRPRADRWHSRPTPLLGGLGIGVATLLALSLSLPATTNGFVIILGGAAALALGLVDDLRRLAPATKVVGQVAIAGAIYFGGIRVLLIDYAPVSFLLTTVWIVGLMNAVNLMDNMDGLAGGVVVIAGTALALVAVPGEPTAALVAVATAGAALGFLLHNFFPARVFMGDAGSQFLGLMLALAAILATASGAADVMLTIAGPLAVLAVPLFDSTLVAVSRRLAGRPISQGGRDHTSHRLAALGLSDRGAVLFLYAVAVALAGLGLLMNAAVETVLPLAALIAVGLLLLGAFFHEIEVYGGGTSASLRNRRDTRIAKAIWSHGRFGAHVLLDVVLLTVACYAAFLLRFEGERHGVWLALFATAAPFVVTSQLCTLTLLGAYRMLWRYLAVTDAAIIALAVIVGTGTAAAALFAVFGPTQSAAVFILDALLAMGLLIASRYFGIWLRRWFAGRPRIGERRVLIVGATEAGALALRALASPGRTGYRALGFVDDDPGKSDRSVAGVPVLGPTTDLPRLMEHHRPDLVLIALSEQDGSSAERVESLCRSVGVACRRFIMPV